ncbi:D-2-hydroxyacid dehydrogenase [Leifsonia sp. NPDC058194]|uniref:D-2-hydroxyacid dehydrogenase n=1 Tax=Leifsonia sp. NPDC058194 TaxID=3346374 RepID=UPI0036DE5F0D
MTNPELRVAVVTPFDPGLAELVVRLEPRIRLDWDPELLPPMRRAADFGGDPAFRRTSEQQRRFEASIDRADALYGIPDLSADEIARAVRANPRLRWVHTMAAGGGGTVKRAGLTAEELRRVAFTTSAGVHGGPLAEFALFGLLAGAKDLPRLRADQQSRTWPERWGMGQLADQTVLVLGLGGIGGEVARLLTAFGARVIGTSRHERHAPDVDEQVRPEALIAVAARVDAVVVALPGTTATDGMLGRAFFEAAKPGLTVVNVGRGTVIDEDALLAALDAGRVGFAALDVTAVEPLPDSSPLWTHPRVLLSPHTAALTDGEERRIAELFADNATRLLDGRPLRNRVDTVDFY